jgi:hypothetical protein
MNKLILAFSFLLFISSCKPGAGPLVRDNFSEPGTDQAVGQKNNKSSVKIEKMNVKVEPCKDCTMLADLLENKKAYSGKNIKVSGKVTKFNPSIMGKNWIHIQDGSEYNGEFDLTITTDREVTVGETITFEGKIALDKDFGYGYFYSVLMEEGKPVQ